MNASVSNMNGTDLIEIELFARRVAMLYDNARSAILAATGVALVLVVVLLPVIPHLWLVIWITAMICINLARYWQLYAFYRAAPDKTEMKHWLDRFTLGAAFSGMIWGSAGIAFIPEKHGIYQAFTILMLCGIAGAASTTYSSVLSVYRAYVFPITIPVIIYMMYIGDEVHIGLGITITLFLLLTSQRSVRIMHDTLVESLKFGLQNEALVKRLEASVIQYQQAQADIAEMSELNKAVIQHTDSGIMAYKPDGQCILMNVAAANMMSVSIETGLKTTFHQLAIWKKTGLLEAAQQVLNTGLHQLFEAPLRTIYGQDIWLVVHLWRISKGNEPILLVVAHDIADHKNIENALQSAKEHAEKAARIKSQFLADMASAVHAPVNELVRIVDSADFKALKNSQAGTLLEELVITVNHLSDVMNNIIDFSNVETDDINIEKHHFSLRQLLDEILAPAKIYAGDKLLPLICTVSDEIPDALIGDSLRLRQTLTILVGNAIKHTEHGQIVLSVTKRAQIGQRICLEYSVQDTGMGMTNEQQMELLQQSVESTGQPVSHANGYGLMAWKTLVTQMGGEIEISSTLGQGSRFLFTVNLELDVSGGN